MKGGCQPKAWSWPGAFQTIRPVARASGIDIDARRDHPFAAYGEMTFPWKVPVYQSGDVYARTMVRVEEAGESVNQSYSGNDL